MNLLSKVLQAVLEVALPVLVSALAAWAAAKAREVFMRVKELKPDAYYVLMSISSVAVNAAEQVFKGQGLGEEKKRYAIDIAEKWLASKGIEIDIDVIAAAIEAQVREMNISKEQQIGQPK